MDYLSLYLSFCVFITYNDTSLTLVSPSDPDIPQSFQVKSWNRTTISLVWAPPENRKYSIFLITAFYLNGTGDVIEEAHSWHTDDSLAFGMSDLHPCTRVRFGLQTVCETGMESQYSEMVYNDGNSRKYNFPK